MRSAIVVSPIGRERVSDEVVARMSDGCVVLAIERSRHKKLAVSSELLDKPV